MLILGDTFYALTMVTVTSSVRYGDGDVQCAL